MTSANNYAISTITRNPLTVNQLKTELDLCLDDLKVAIANAGEVNIAASDFANKGTFSAILSSISGTSDKNLAKLIEKTAASLKVSQRVLETILKTQTQKNQFLREFHDALVKKIELLQTDTDTMDESQREAAIAIVEALSDHVAAQMASQDMVEQHQKWLQDLGEELHNVYPKLRTLEEDRQKHIDMLGRIGEGLDAVIKENDNLTATTQAANEHIEVLSNTLAHQAKEITTLRTAQEQMMQRYQSLADDAARQNALPAFFKRNAISIGAFIMGATSLAYLYR
ncbi:hypothetical protein [Collimonas sp. OK412]|jgi:chromosome segregation ATPase|uniref:hypothetical protein n=1 Tax=Collimonas sp. (strain OK412) TaxID=1801619 RepID=UPI0008E339E2|nr:hypothetical protein [Collimonas sp. OK412]SFC74565.1 hypothetical protein SAMN04515619_112124 [Collimonas sp. OK412]